MIKLMMCMTAHRPNDLVREAQLEPATGEMVDKPIRITPARLDPLIDGFRCAQDVHQEDRSYS